MLVLAVLIPVAVALFASFTEIECAPSTARNSPGDAVKQVWRAHAKA